MADNPSKPLPATVLACLLVAASAEAGTAGRLAKAGTSGT